MTRSATVMLRAAVLVGMALDLSGGNNLNGEEACQNTQNEKGSAMFPQARPVPE